MNTEVVIPTKQWLAEPFKSFFKLLKVWKKDLQLNLLKVFLNPCKSGKKTCSSEPSFE